MIRSLLNQWRIVALALTLLGVIAAVSFYFYGHASEQMKGQLRNELKGVAAAAAVSVDGDVVERIDGPDDMQSTFFRDLVEHLRAVRQAGNNIRFAYILRRTDDPSVLEFVADADSLATPEELDVNGNGIVDPDEEGSYPGDLYDAGEIPALHGPAFLGPYADADIYVDQWGALVSGYAPVRNGAGEVVGVLAIDMEAEDFIASSYSVFSPAALLLILVMGMVASVTVYAVSERRQINLLQHINMERSGLLRLTFHQLGEPLTIMKWSLESLRDETQSPELHRLVEEHIVCMDEGLGRLNSIIDTLQLAEKVDLNTLEYLPVPTSLRELVDNAVNEWDSSLRKRNQRMHVFVKDDIVLPMDKTLLMLVMRQILVNAIEYSDDGSEIQIHVEKNRKHVTVSIQDEGCGIPKEDMQHLFEKYRRASNAHLKKPDGNGLGLYIARGIVEKAGGEIRVKSEQDKGTTVSFTLPLPQEQ